MSDRDTILFRLTKETAKEIETWRKKISEAIKIDLNKVTKKQGEIAFRISSKRGNVKLSELRDILLGKIK
jgi:hypothetical protein